MPKHSQYTPEYTHIQHKYSEYTWKYTQNTQKYFQYRQKTPNIHQNTLKHNICQSTPNIPDCTPTIPKTTFNRLKYIVKLVCPNVLPTYLNIMLILRSTVVVQGGKGETFFNGSILSKLAKLCSSITLRQKSSLITIVLTVWHIYRENQLINCLGILGVL